MRTGAIIEATTTPAAGDPPSRTPRIYTPEAGKEALAALAPVLDAITDDQLASVRLDVEAATYAALSVAAVVSSPEVRARFARLPAEEVDLADVDGLTPACFAMLYALAEARVSRALETDARLPAALVAEATDVEQRMQGLCEYHFDDDPEIKPELDRLRPGIGHRDLANDLLGYARIYRLREGVVKSDPTRYRPEDAARAVELAGAIIQALSAAMTPRARVAYDRYVRAWTLLARRYDEVRATGLWLFRKDPGAERRFPSLYVAGRPNVGRPRKSAQKDAGDERGGAGRSAGDE